MLFLLWLLVASLALWAVVAHWAWVPALVAAVLAAGGFLWVLASVLSPAVPDRTCPRCRGEGLVKIRRGRPGVWCELCGHRDEAMHVAYLDEW